MTTLTINFGNKTRSGFGGYPSGNTAASAITGTGNADWVIDSRGDIVPAGTYGAVAIFTLSSYALTLANGTLANITIVNKAAHIKDGPADGTSTFQLRSLLITAIGTSGAMLVGDTIYQRDNTQVNPNSLLFRTRPPALGYGGHGTIIGGSAYVSGTYLNVPLTGGTGHGAKANIKVTSGIVTNVTMRDPGAGYTPGDVLSASNANLGGAGSGFTYTVIDLTATIVICSETADNSIDADGNYARGGLAKTGGYSFDAATSGDIWFPYTFQDITFYSNFNGVHINFLGYNSTVGYGIAAKRCRFENGPAVSQTNSKNTAFSMQDSVCDSCYIRNVERGVSGGGMRNLVGIPNQATNNVFKDLLSDAHTLQGVNLIVRGEFAFNFAFAAGEHPDFCQHLGFFGTYVGGTGYTNGTYNSVPFTTVTGVGTGMTGQVVIASGSIGKINVSVANQGTGYLPGDIISVNPADVGGTGSGFTYTLVGPVTGFGIWEKNIGVRNVGLAGNGDAQGLFGDDTGPIATVSDGVVRNNITFLSATNGIEHTRFINPVVNYNTTLSPVGTNYAYDVATIRSSYGTGGTYNNNVTGGWALNNGGSITNNNPITLPDVLATYKVAMPNFVGGANPGITTYAEAIRQATPANLAVASGGFKNPDGTFNGALFPDGSWNDGTVYGAGAATSYTQNSTTTTLGLPGSATVSYQLNGSNAGGVTITPHVTGVTGTFFPATLVLGPGVTSGTLTFLPTTAGTAVISATNSSTLTNPSNFNITVTAAASPTTYSQAASPGTLNPGGSSTITYILDQPAVAAVTITPASNLAGVFNPTTAVIPIGSSSAAVTFTPTITGTATISATNDKSLTNPVNLSILVNSLTRAQLFALGIRP